MRGEQNVKANNTRGSATARMKADTDYNMNQLEDGMLGEGGLVQKATGCRFPFIRNVQKRQIQREGKQSSGCPGAGV